MVDRSPKLVVIALTTSAMMAVGAGGCVRRTITIDSSPPGALVWLNDREVGRTPVDVDFLHYGTYDVRLELAGYEPLSTSGEARPPWWDTVGVDLVAELLPTRLESDVVWTYELEPQRDDRAALIERARSLRAESEPAPATDTP